MILQIYCGNESNLILDVLCMEHEYEEYVNSLKLCSKPIEIISDIYVDGLREVKVKVEDDSFIKNYLYKGELKPGITSN